jgi:hypothetical protein
VRVDAVSDKFLAKSYPTGSVSMPHSLVMLNVCSTFKGANRLPTVFIEAGAAAVPGWDGITKTAAGWARLIIEKMLSGSTLGVAFASLPPRFKSSDTCRPPEGEALDFRQQIEAGVTCTGTFSAGIPMGCVGKPAPRVIQIRNGRFTAPYERVLPGTSRIRAARAAFFR